MSIKVRVSYERHRLVIESGYMHLYSADFERALPYRSLVWGKEKGVCFVAHYYLPLVLRILNKRFKPDEIYVSRDIPDIERIEGLAWGKDNAGNLITKGGEIDMGITIEAEKPIDPGTYDAKIAKVDAKEGKFGTRLQVTFELPDGRSVNGFFAPKATVNNKTGRLFEKALGKIETADSDDLLGKTVKVLIEENHRDGTTYTNVSKIL